MASLASLRGKPGYFRRTALYLAGLPRLQSIASVPHCQESYLADESHTSSTYSLGTVAVQTATVKQHCQQSFPSWLPQGTSSDTSGALPQLGRPSKDRPVYRNSVVLSRVFDIARPLIHSRWAALFSRVQRRFGRFIPWPGLFLPGSLVRAPSSTRYAVRILVPSWLFLCRKISLQLA
jgi:hypothetical protein